MGRKANNHMNSAMKTSVKKISMQTYLCLILSYFSHTNAPKSKKKAKCNKQSTSCMEKMCVQVWGFFAISLKTIFVLTVIQKSQTVFATKISFCSSGKKKQPSQLFCTTPLVCYLAFTEETPKNQNPILFQNLRHS